MQYLLKDEKRGKRIKLNMNFTRTMAVINIKTEKRNGSSP